MERGRGVWAIVIAALLLHGGWLGQRAALERANDTVELVLDYEGVLAVAADQGVAARQLLERWRTFGVTAIGVGRLEDDVGQDGALGVDGFAPDEAGPGPEYWVAFASDEDGAAVGRIVPRTLAAVEGARGEGSGPASTISVGPYIPRGDRVEGFPDDMVVSAAILAEADVPFGLVEFASPAGEADLARRLGYDVVVVHSIPPRELLHLTFHQATARFRRAVLERQARLLYVHLLPGYDGILYDEYIRGIADAVRRAGFHLGPASRAPRGVSSWWLPGSAALAAGGVFLLLWRRLWAGRFWIFQKWSGLVQGVAVVGPFLGVAGLMAGGWDVLARQGAALAVALVFPVATMVGATDVVARASGGRRGARAWPALLLTLLGGVAGGLLVAGSLGDTRFLLNLAQFRGVKVAHAVPLAAWSGFVFAAHWLGSNGKDPGRLRGALRGIQLRVDGRAVAFAFVVAAVGFVLVARTGHDVLPVPAAERALRQWLEMTLPVRPRTKEFLLGYPALVVGLWRAASRPGRRDGWTAALLALGGVVPVSIVNTFAHAHIPLSISLLRTGLGALLGGAFGFAAIGLMAVWSGAFGRRAQETGTETTR